MKEVHPGMPHAARSNPAGKNMKDADDENFGDKKSSVLPTEISARNTEK